MSRKLPSLLLLCGALLTLASLAHAHPGTGYNLRAAHFEHSAEGITAYLRISLTLAVANRLGEQRPDGTFVPAPYTYNRLESGRVFHYLDIAAVKRDVARLGELVASGHELSVDGKPVTPKVLAVSVHPKGKVPPFSKLEAAKNAVGGAPYPDVSEEIDTGYVLVDVALSYVRRGGIERFDFKSSLGPGELGEPLTRNILWDHRGESVSEYDVDGLLHAPITIEAHQKKEDAPQKTEFGNIWSRLLEPFSWFRK
jgi:hypothetical protein